MLERSRKAEAELRHSEQEAASLRRNLDRARRDAEVDFLTGLPNRRAFEVALERQYAEAQAAGDALSVAFCDIDHFKLVNDTHGHEAGDRILCVVAKTLSQISGEKCHIARHGGEEFVMLFRGATPEEAFAMLDNARVELASRKLVNRRTEQPFGQVTFSGGIADVFAHANPRTALAAADEALYRAKEGGRNQIRLAGQPD
jgi:diguanylate cyclase